MEATNIDVLELIIHLHKSLAKMLWQGVIYKEPERHDRIGTDW